LSSSLICCGEEKSIQIKIRYAFPQNADVLFNMALSAKAYWGYPDRWMEIWAPQLTFSPEYFGEIESWVAEVGGVPVAFYTLQEKGGNGWIENLWVRPEFIGKGIGKRLFLHAVTRSRLKGLLILQLEADPNALGFYEKMGMYKIGERKSEIEGQPRILPVMEIELRELA
jgi:ribosomal protein S18 acetylase RimI-like enzyme